VSQKKLGKRKVYQVPGPRLLTGDDMARIQKAFFRGEISRDDAWVLFHFVMLALNVQSDLIKESEDPAQKRAHVGQLYLARLEQYQGALLAVSEPAEGTRTN
jgi:hypothetical protein